MRTAVCNFTTFKILHSFNTCPDLNQACYFLVFITLVFLHTMKSDVKTDKQQQTLVYSIFWCLRTIVVASSRRRSLCVTRIDSFTILNSSCFWKSQFSRKMCVCVCGVWWIYQTFCISSVFGVRFSAFRFFDLRRPHKLKLLNRGWKFLKPKSNML